MCAKKDLFPKKGDFDTKQLNLFKQFEGSKRLSNYLEEGVAWKWAD